MSDAAIAGGENKQTPPASPAPAATANNSSSNQGQTVTLTKEEHDKLQKDLQTARDLQAQADKRAARLEKAFGRKDKHFTPESLAPKPEPTKEELESRAVEEDRKAERGLLQIAIDPKYREALDADPTLRNLLTSNPLGVLPILAPDALDAEDAIELVTEQLDKRVADIAAKKNPPADDKTKTPPATPPAGAVNTTDKQVDEEYEAAKKIPNTEGAVASMVKIGLRKLGGKK